MSEPSTAVALGDPQHSERDMGSSNSGDLIAANAALTASIHIANVRDLLVGVIGYVTA